MWNSPQWRYLSGHRENCLHCPMGCHRTLNSSGNLHKTAAAIRPTGNKRSHACVHWLMALCPNMEMVANLVAEEICRCFPQQHLMMRVDKWFVARNGEVIVINDRRGVWGMRGLEPSICIQYLNKQHHQKLYSILISSMSVCACAQCACVCYLNSGPCGAFTHIRHTETKAVRAAKWIVFLQVVETWFAQITVSSHHVHLRKREQASGNRRDVRQEARC